MLGTKKMAAISKLMIFVSTIIWGSSFFILKNTLDEIPVCFILCIRFLSSALLFSVIFFKRWKNFSRKYIWTGGITGLFLGLAYITQTVGLKYTTPGISAFLTTVYCVLVPFMCWKFKHKAPDKFNVIAALLCFAGIGLISLGDSGIEFSFMGEGLTLICGVFFAAHMVAISVWGDGLDIVLFTIVQFFTAFLVCLVGFLAYEEMPSAVSDYAYFSLFYVSVFATAIAFLFMNCGVKYASATSTALISSLESVFGVLFSLLFYPDEIMTVKIALGFAAIFIGIIINETKLSFLNINKDLKIS